ncbi:hypothetical protein [Paenibacillus sp. GP183]|jgi:hypothetical protein|uniref:hypothetical protein n=1 Tax=Paenibacillus sp. GP183 TaxID=1882751 RepID=UPI0008963075|nr:hypothetical protein [Paenibacillus sp. GP183]SEC21860.1 hypothetical protein SAMN05443246_3380 [Paenibacillus sp. GP183]
MFMAFCRIGAAAVSIALLAGCANSNPSNPNVKSYPQDGYMGMTSVNPNNPMNPTYHHYQDDTHLMNAVMAQFPDIQESRIQFKGAIADVRLRFKEGLGPVKEDQLRSAVQMALSTNMPRYSVRVTVPK